jgi:hypothetical protein
VKQWYGATVWSSVMRETWACAWLIVEIREVKQWYGAPGDGATVWFPLIETKNLSISIFGSGLTLDNY